MIQCLEIESFKSFINESISLSNLTVLTGLNSSGKSSILQAIRMSLFSQESKSPYIKGYGGFQELKSKLTNINSDIILKIIWGEGEFKTLILKKDSVRVSPVKAIDTNFDYIGADRHGPLSILPTFDYNDKYVGVGDKGQYSVDYYLNLESVLVKDDLLHKETSSRTLSKQLEAWMGEISPGVDLNFSKVEKHDFSHLEIDGNRATNTGFGISYSLPIVLAALVMSSKDENAGFERAEVKEWFDHNQRHTPALLVENPEAHLHPKGQTIMGKLLALAAANGVQVIVETHSDHFLDGVRIQVKQQAIESKKVKIYFFEKDSNGESIKTKINIKNDGKLDMWPRGFFDQTMLNLRDLSI